MSAPRVAVVTGGGSGIGLATSARLIEDGFTLAVLDLDGDAAKSAAGPTGLGIGVDVTDAGGVETAFANIVAEFGRIDILVNNAGISGGPTATRCHETPVEEWDRVQAVNVRGPFLCSSAVLPIMLSQGSGHIITIASVAGGMVVFPKRCAYVASKAAALIAGQIHRDRLREGRHPLQRGLPCPGLHPDDRLATGQPPVPRGR